MNTHSIRPIRGGAVAGLVLTLGALLVGCGAADDQLAEGAAEEAVEQAMEQQGASDGQDVDVDLDAEDGKMSIESEDGSMTVGGGEIPDSFPADLPLPSGDYKVVTSIAIEGEESHSRVVLQTPGTYEDFAEPFQRQLEDAGYDVSVGTMQSGDTSAVNISASSVEHEVIMTLTEAPMAEGEVLISYAVVPATAE